MVLPYSPVNWHGPFKIQKMTAPLRVRSWKFFSALLSLGGLVFEAGFRLLHDGGEGGSVNDCEVS